MREFTSVKVWFEERASPSSPVANWTSTRALSLTRTIAPARRRRRLRLRSAGLNSWSMVSLRKRRSPRHCQRETQPDAALSPIVRARLSEPRSTESCRSALTAACSACCCACAASSCASRSCNACNCARSTASPSADTVTWPAGAAATATDGATCARQAAPVVAATHTATFTIRWVMWPSYPLQTQGVKFLSAFTSARVRARSAVGCGTRPRSAR